MSCLVSNSIEWGIKMSKKAYEVGKRYIDREDLETAREVETAFESIPAEFEVYECILLDGPNGPVFNEVGSSNYYDLETIGEVTLVELKAPLTTWGIVQDRPDGTASFVSFGYANRKVAETIVNDFYTAAKGYRVVEMREVYG
jgi:hypothetical protein